MGRKLLFVVLIIFCCWICSCIQPQFQRRIKDSEKPLYDNEIQAFDKKYLEDLKCQKGFSFRISEFENMLNNLKISAKPEDPNFTYGIRVYPALSPKSGLYLVFFGDTIAPKNDVPDRYYTMLNSELCILESNDLGFKLITDEKLKENIKRQIKDFQEKYLPDFTCKSYNAFVDSSRFMISDIFKYGDQPQLKIFYAIKTFPAIDVANKKLRLISKGEEISFATGSERRVVLSSKNYYDQMDPCPDKCPKTEILFK